MKMARELWRGALLCAAATALALVLAEGVLALLGHDPYRPYVMKPNREQTVRHLESTVHYKTNSQGLRSPEIPLRKPEGARRIVILGDSFVMGYGVEERDALPRQLERLLRGEGEEVSVINAGIGATGPFNYARVLWRRALRYDPDLVLVMIYANDLTETQALPEAWIRDRRLWLGSDKLELQSKPFKVLAYRFFPRLYVNFFCLKENIKRGMTYGPDYIRNAEILAEYGGIPKERFNAWAREVRRIASPLIEPASRDAFNGLILTIGLQLPQYWSGSLDLSTPDAEDRWRTFRAVMEAMREMVEERGAQIRYIYLPTLYQYDPGHHRISRDLGAEIREEWMAEEESRFQTRLRKLAEESGVPYLDMTPFFRRWIREDPELNFRWDDHWRPEGHRRAAEAIARWLLDTDAGSGPKGQGL